MSKRSILVMFVVATLVGSVLPVLTQGGGQAGPPGRGGGQAVSLPDGAGKDLVQTHCTKCHALSLLSNSGGYTRQGWEELSSSMVSLPKDQAAVLVGYLEANFPETPRPKAVIVPGPVQVNIKEWIVPSLGSRPHDPLATPDGMVWWTGQYASVLGRLDPKTGQMKEFPTYTAASGPHGLTADRD